MRSPYILMIENDEDDQYITSQYFGDFSVPAKIFTTTDELFPYLQRCIENKNDLPALILLDYYTTPLNAAETLAIIKKNKSVAHIPVVVLCGIKSGDIVKECYRCGASSFIQKPTLVEDTNRKVSNFLEYWFKTVELN